MSDNIFFDPKKLKYLGNNVIIGKTVRIRYPELVEIHDDVIIDDFVFISTGLIIENHSTIMPNCSFTGGPTHKIRIKSYSSVASGCSLMTSSHDFVRSLHLTHRNDFDQDFIRGDILLDPHVIIGCNTTIMPGISIGEGARVGAQSFVNKNLDPWTLYGGVPAKPIGKIDQVHILDRLEKFNGL